MKKILLFTFLLSVTSNAQNYIDLFKIGYSENFNNEFEDTNSTTDIHSLDVDLTVPVVIDENNAIVTGVLFSRNNLDVFPDQAINILPIPAPEPFSSNVSLYNTILKIGLAKTFNEKWSGTFLVLPKLASDYQDITGEDFYVGGLAYFKYKKTENLSYRFGWYAMDQAFGLFTTPIVGFYYLSPDEKLEMDVAIPVSADINYSVGTKTKVGFNYYAIGRSFDIHLEDIPETYVDYVALEFTGYVEQAFLDNSVLVRLKAGYATNSAEVYANDDTVDFRVAAFDFGDNRTQLNPDLSGSVFAKIEAVYRFDLSDR